MVNGQAFPYIFPEKVLFKVLFNIVLFTTRVQLKDQDWFIWSFSFVYCKASRHMTNILKNQFLLGNYFLT